MFHLCEYIGEEYIGVLDTNTGKVSDGQRGGVCIGNRTEDCGVEPKTNKNSKVC